MQKTVILAERPDLVMKLEKYGVMPPLRSGSPYEGCARKWSKERRPPYDDPKYQAMAERLPIGWEELTVDEMNQLLGKLREAIEKKRKEKVNAPNLGGEMMFKRLVKISLIAIAAATASIKQGGLEILPETEEGEKMRSHQFAIEMVLSVLNGSNLFYDFFREGAKLIKTDTAQQDTIAEILKTIAVMTVIFVAAGENEERRRSLLFGFKKAIQEGLEKSERFVNEALIKGTIESETAKGVALYLQQACIAVRQDDFDGMQQAFEGLLRLLHFTHEQLMNDIDKVHQLAEQLRKAFTSGMDDATNKLTAISQVM